MGEGADGLTDNERRVLAYYVRELGLGASPAIREAAAALGLAHTTVQSVIDRLVEKGRLDRESGAHRGLRLPGRARGFAKPVAGYVAAGTPMPPRPPEDEFLEFQRIFGPDDVQILRVRGTSMVEAGILDGDYVAVRPCAKADAGRVVVAEIDGCHTLKVFRFFRGHPYLYPRNREMQPIKLNARDDPRLLGVYVGLVRIAKVK